MPFRHRANHHLKWWFVISVVINGNIVNKSIIEKVEFNRSKFTKIYLVGEIVSNNNLNIFIKVLT